MHVLEVYKIERDLTHFEVRLKVSEGRTSEISKSILHVPWMDMELGID